MNVFITGDTHWDFSRIYNFCERVGTTRDDSRLHGKKHLINGNHDSSWMNKVDVSKYFKTVELMSVISDGAYAMTLCHYPFLTWSTKRHHIWFMDITIPILIWTSGRWLRCAKICWMQGLIWMDFSRYRSMNYLRTISDSRKNIRNKNIHLPMYYL